MKVLLIKDVFKLGRAGDIKKVADGFGRNYLIPQGLAILATPGALKQAERIRTQANAKRAVINQEMSGIAEQLSELVLVFPAKAGETDKLYGSITPQMIAEAIEQEKGVEITRRQMDFQPIRMLGMHKVSIRLTIDLIPEITVVVHREGEAPILPGMEVEPGEEMETEAEVAPEATTETEMALEATSEAEAVPLEEEDETESVAEAETA